MSERIVIKNVLTATPESCRKSDVIIEKGIISVIGDGILSSEGDRLIDGTGKLLTYGLTDVHVHFREPGFSYKETVGSGSAAAARGGYTCVCPMPNLNPAPDTVEHLNEELEIIRRDGTIDIRPYSTITMERKGKELVDIHLLKEHCVAFSDDGSGVQDDNIMYSAMKAAASEDVIIAAHCEVNDLLQGGYIHKGNYASEHGHAGICSESEWKQIERDIRLAAETGCAYHVCHISTKESVQLIREAKKNGVNISCETGPHYLILCDKDLQEDGRFKMNPPLRSEEDRDALIEGILDGTIDMIATDHAPHSAEEKNKGLKESAFGIVGLETAFPLLYTHLVKKGIIPLEKLVSLMSSTPRKRFAIGGSLKEGEEADLALFDITDSFTVNPDNFLSKGHSTPFAGWELTGDCIMTIYKGEIVYEKRR